MSRALPLIAAVVLFSGCPTAYLNATGEFARAARDGASTLSSTFELSTELCRDRADLAYLLPRLKAQYGAPSSFTAAPLRSKWFDDKSAGPAPGLSWADHCGAIAAADRVHRYGLQVIAAYGGALQAVIGQGGFQGEDLRSISASAATLEQKIGGAAGAGYTGAIAGIGAPLSALTDMLLAKIVANELRKKVSGANPSFQTILRKLSDYVGAAGELELLDLSAILANLLDELEFGLGPQKDLADPIRGLEYYKFAAHWEARLRFYRRIIDASKKLIGDLKEAHGALEKAGKGDGAVNGDDLKRLAGLTQAVLGEAALFRAQIAPPLGVP